MTDFTCRRVLALAKEKGVKTLDSVQCLGLQLHFKTIINTTHGALACAGEVTRATYLLFRALQSKYPNLHLSHAKVRALSTCPWSCTCSWSRTCPWPLVAHPPLVAHLL